MKDGFYAVLGTPADFNGLLVKASFVKEIKLMFDEGSQGVFTQSPIDRNTLKINLKYLYNILKLHNLFLKENILSAYSYAMTLLGCKGDYQSDYDMPISKLKDEITICMKEINEI